MRKAPALIIVFIVFGSFLASPPAARASDECELIGVALPGTRFEQDFGLVCGAEAKAQSRVAKANYEANYSSVLAEEAADALNCVEPITSFTGDDRWVRTFPGVCTAAAIAARAVEVEVILIM